MNYTDVTAVRSEAGFTGNPSVTDEYIEQYLNQSHSIVQSYVASVYRIGDMDLSNALFVGSQAAGLLKRAEELISAGYVLLNSYGIEAQDSDKGGQKKIDEGTRLLLGLSTAKNPLRLIDLDGNEFQRVSGTSAGSIIATGIGAEDVRKFSTKMSF